MASTASGTSALLTAVQALAPEIAARADEGERERGMPHDLVQRLRAAGLFRMMVPKQFGGEELDLLQGVRVIEELAKADGSAGWNAMVIFGFNIAFSRFAPKTVSEIFAAGPDVMARGALAPLGKAIPTDNGFRISGQWPFASGSYTPDWIIATAVVMENDRPRLGRNGMPEIRTALLRAERTEFLDTWYTVGLRGSASHDFVVKDQFVATEYTTNFFDPTIPSAFDTKMYRLPFLLWAAPTHSAVVVGIAQAALDEVATLSRTKRSAFNPGARLVDDPTFKFRLGELATRLNTLRAALYRQVEDALALAEDPASLTPLSIAGSSALVAYTHVECVDIVNELFTLMSSTPVYSKSALQRRWRDVRCAAQHFSASQNSYTGYGGLLAGEPPGPGMF